MKYGKTTYQGIEVYNMGTNNYSEGMEAVIFRTQDVDKVKSLPNVYLHPSIKPDESGIYTIVGTEENYKKFYQSVVKSNAAKQAFNEIGQPNYDDREAWDKIHNRCMELEETFKPWYV